MRLKGLQVQGYKSFASRTEFAFLTGVTAIVGPNGSGKSNVADAIRWVLGEQSVRMLRGKSTEDMIYSGGQRRARAGMAEVLLTLDNGDRWLPVEYAEVTIGRRAYRSGENEYLLNGSRVRLRDLADLLAQSGLVQRTYTVIGQGLIDTALSLRPQERRALFEEAAGISVYRARREEAAGRLEETGRNMERVRDILSEIAPRVRRLEEQVARLHEHEQVSTQLRERQQVWYGYHWGQAQTALTNARGQAAALQETLSGRRAEIELVAAQLNDLRQQQTQMRASLRDDYLSTANLHDQANAVQRESATLAERSRLLGARQEEIREELEPLVVQEEAQGQRVAAAQARVDELRAQAATQENRAATLSAELDELRRQAQEQVARQTQAQQEQQALRARQAELEAAVAESRRDQARLEAERDVLARLREAAGGMDRGARAILQKGLPGVEGVLGRLIRVPAEWEQGVEAALGPCVQALVVRDWDVVEAVKAALTPEEQVTLLPLTEMRPQPAGSRVVSPLLCAADVVNCEPILRPVVETVLGQTALCAGLQEARETARELPPASRCVTPAGEVVTAEGLVMMGVGGGTLARERLWRDLPERMEAARQRREELEAEATHHAQAVTALETALQEAARGVREANAQVAQIESGPLAQARTDLMLARQALEGQRTLLQRELANGERVKAQIAARQARARALADEREAAEKQLAGLRERVVRFEKELAQVRSRIGPAEEELSRLAQQQEQAESQERQVRERVQRMEERVNAGKLDVVRCQERASRLQERIREDLGLVELELADQFTAQTPLPLRPIVSALPVVETLPEGLEEEIQRLKARLRQIGPVNPNVLQEYEETAGRFQFLSEQVADLDAASARLIETIADLDRMMEEAFRETFEAIAAAFEEAFTRLFNGGAARLELTDPDNLTQTGVDIVARPPGKRPQSLALLSGGERALTAAALIFAILRVRPTPFCVLDEVDAMLDESNVTRFRGMLLEFSSQTQFIVITHNRHTVEAADTVYGVSMGSDGASQVVSLRLEEAKAPAETEQAARGEE